MSDIFIATETFATTVDGSPVVVYKDKTRVREGHPLLDGREELFKEIDVDYDIEQATDAPGAGREASITKPKSYDGLKQPKLKELLDERGISYPQGPVSNADLVALLQASDSSS